MQIFLLICLYITCCIDIDKFPQVFKHVHLVSVHKKKGKKMIKLVIELSAYFQTLLQLTKKTKCNRLYDYFDKTLFPSQCGFW